MGMKFANFAEAPIATAPSGTTGLSFSVATGLGALFPTLGAGDYAYGTFVNAERSVFEVVKITGRSGDSFTIDADGRGVDGTTALTWTAADYFYVGLPRIALEMLFTAAALAIAGLTGAADKLPYFTGAEAMALADFPLFGRTLIAATDAPTGRDVLNLPYVLPPVDEFGAVADGSTNSGSVINTALVDGPVFVPSSALGYASSVIVTVPANSGIHGRNRLSKMTLSHANGVAITGDNAVIEDLSLVAAATNTQALYAGASNVDGFRARRLYIDATLGLHGVQMAQSGVADWGYDDIYIHAKQMAFLLNTGAVGSGLRISDATLISDSTDALNLNSPNKTFSNVVLRNLTLAAKGAFDAGNLTSGFPLAIAGVDGVSGSDIIITEARNEAVHVEDLQKGGRLTRVRARHCRRDGIRILAFAGAEPVQVTNSEFVSDTVGTAGTGAYIVYDGSSVSRCDFSHSRFVNFLVGLYAGRSTVVNMAGALIEGCPTAIAGAGGNHILGPIIVRGATAVGATFADGGSRVGMMIFEDACPAVLLEKTNSGSHPGVVLEGFRYPIIWASHPGGGAVEEIEIVSNLPNRISGQITVSIGQDGADGAHYTSEINWTGSALTAPNPKATVHGTYSLGVLNESGNDLRIQLGKSGASATNLHVTVMFQGEYEVA